MKNSAHHLLLFLCFVLLQTSFLNAQAENDSPLPRTIVTLYDGRVYPDIFFTRMHQYAEMPLNHLGVKLDYYDLLKGLPDIKDRTDVVGVLVWFPKYTNLPEAEKYLAWASEVIDSGKKFVVMGTPGFYVSYNPVPLHVINAFWHRLGLEDNNDWVNDTYEGQLIEKDPKVVEFERTYRDLKPAYELMKVVDEKVSAHLVSRQYGDSSTDSVLVATGPNGGYAYEGYERYEIFNEKERFRQWYINPFEFFNKAFDLQKTPKPDTTTLAGRRIFYSHIDGDGWNSVTELEKYRRKKMISAEVILNEIIIPNQDLPITVGVIAADIDPDWVGSEKSIEVAKKIFSQPNVEVGTHTYSHPFDWKFFEHYTAEKETPFFSNYRHGTWKGSRLWNTLTSFWNKVDVAAGEDRSKPGKKDKKELDTTPQAAYDVSVDVLKLLSEGYDTPRAFANQPFSLVSEVQGAIEKSFEAALSKKKVALYQWSGNCEPFEEAVKLTRDLGVRNINGGDTRYDTEFLSYAWVGALGRKIGQQQQIYASASNENTYTDNWSGRFYGFDLLPETLENTETPLRLKPMNIYFHMFSGEKLPSLEALTQNFEYVRTKEVIPIETSRFAGIVDGFYSIKIIPLEEKSWKFIDRGELQTIRFDRCVLCSVDFTKSKGVVGQRHHQGSLYVYLDEGEHEPIIALRESLQLFEETPDQVPYLIESRWRVWGLERNGSERFRFIAQGFGKGEMRWKVPDDGNFLITWSRDDREPGSLVVGSLHGELSFVIDQNVASPIEITIQQKK